MGGERHAQTPRLCTNEPASRYVRQSYTAQYTSCLAHALPSHHPQWHPAAPAATSGALPSGWHRIAFAQLASLLLGREPGAQSSAMASGRPSLGTTKASSARLSFCQPGACIVRRGLRPPQLPLQQRRRAAPQLWAALLHTHRLHNLQTPHDAVCAALFYMPGNMPESTKCSGNLLMLRPSCGQPFFMPIASVACKRLRDEGVVRGCCTTVTLSEILRATHQNTMKCRPPWTAFLLAS